MRVNGGAQLPRDNCRYSLLVVCQRGNLGNQKQVVPRHMINKSTKSGFKVYWDFGYGYI